MTFKSILITGGSGSFGLNATRIILNKYPNLERLLIYSRNELKQYEMQQAFPKVDFPNLQFMIGDVRDVERLKRACNGIDVVIHAAAIKMVPTAEANPDEAINTNIGGAQNLIKAAIECGVKMVVALSTDKAAAPVNLYGATKLVAEKLFIAANDIKGAENTRFALVRYGNVLGSNGSVVPFFLEKAKTAIVPITNLEMTRFNILADEAVNIVLWAIENALGREIVIPKIPSYNILALASAIAPEAEFIEVGIRPGEKIHEELITVSDSYNTIDVGQYYIILPPNINKTKYLEHYGGTEIQKGFSYNSRDNENRLLVDDIRKLLIYQFEQDIAQ